MTKAKANVLDILLGVDAGKVKKQRKEVRIKSLSEYAGTDVIFTVEGLSGEQFERVQENVGDNASQTDIHVFALLEGVVSPNLKDKALRERYGAETPKELVKKLLLGGEIANLYLAISEMSGFDEGSVQEVKN
jgi:hypothetical protein